MCEESSTVSPPSATASISDCRNSRRASGSSEAIGSSSTSSSGRLASASMSATCACWPPESWPTSGERDAEPAQPLAARARRPSAGSACGRASASRRPEARGTADGPGRRSRAAAGRPRSLARRPAEHADVARARLASARPQVQQRRLARAVGPDEGVDPPGRELERAIAQRPDARRSACRARPLERPGSCGPSRAASDGGGEQRGDARPRPARPRGACRSSAAAPPAARRASAGAVAASDARDERALAAASLDQPFVLQLAIRLEHGVGVDRELATTSFTVGS